MRPDGLIIWRGFAVEFQYATSLPWLPAMTSSELAFFTGAIEAKPHRSFLVSKQSHQLRKDLLRRIRFGVEQRHSKHVAVEPARSFDVLDQHRDTIQAVDTLFSSFSFHCRLASTL